jgi:hypothetical protein
MTDKTDIAALREECAQWVKDNFGDLIDTRMAENVDGNDYTAWDMLVLWRAWRHLSGQLEAERQRGDYRQQVIDQRNAECDRLIAELAALRGKQEPVGFTNDKGLEALSKGYMVTITPDDRLLSPAPLFTRQPKPVVVLPKSHYVAGCADKFMSEREVQGAMLAAGIVVKDGE